MTQSDFIGLVNGKPRANRACSFEQMVAGAGGSVLPACARTGTAPYSRVRIWRRVHHLLRTGAHPLAASAGGGNRLHRRFYRGEVPAHIGVMISPVKCLHARGEFGFVRCDSPLALLKVYSRVEYMIHGSI